jgi:hypothetical protein
LHYAALRAALEAYRGRWVVAGEAAAGERFTSTTSASATGVPSTFKVRPTRVLPGVPKVVETFREKIIERGGCAALPCECSLCALSTFVQ